MKAAIASFLISSALFLSGCGAGASSGAPQPSVAVQLSANSLRISHGGDSAAVTVTSSVSNGASPVTLSVLALPAGVTANITQPDSSNKGSVSFSVTNAKNVPAATYKLTVQGSAAGVLGAATLSLLVTGEASVSKTTLGAAAFMSTSFQVADWSYTWMKDHPTAATPLNDLAPQHVRLQVIAGALPEKAANAWDFTEMDALVQPVLAVADKSPQLQIGAAPAFMYDTSGKLRDSSYQEFAGFCADLVRYYNKGGFMLAGKKYVSPSSTPITWWGIYNEPNINNVTPDEYVAIYNVVSSAMLAVDPNIKLVAIELSDWGSEPQRFLPPLLTGATAPINAVATHYYGTCNQADTDQTVMSAVSTFANHVRYFRTTLDANSKYAGTPIWVTENNVNADYSNNGKSACDPTKTFVLDPRGSSAFFAAWRPLVYSQLVKAGTAGVWHWSFYGDVQYGEVDGSANKQLSYWVDYYLAHWLSPSATLLDTTSSDDGVEVLAALRADGSKVIVVANHQVNSTTDNNGKGVAKVVTLDLSALGGYTSTSLVAMDSTTNASTGPVATVPAPAQEIELTFPGYGVQMLWLE